ncbi:MAG: hypothetical protein JXE06_02825 [Coriobacteriia bacterium]|nr:hypothetical protein [Coriobacteriia bacterium]
MAKEPDRILADKHGADALLNLVGLSVSGGLPVVGGDVRLLLPVSGGVWILHERSGERPAADHDAEFVPMASVKRVELQIADSARAEINDYYRLPGVALKVVCAAQLDHEELEIDVPMGSLAEVAPNRSTAQEYWRLARLLMTEAASGGVPVVLSGVAERSDRS